MNTPDSNKKLRGFLHGMGMIGFVGSVVGIMLALAQFPLDAVGRGPIKSTLHYIAFFCVLPAPFVLMLVLSFLGHWWIARKMRKAQREKTSKEGNG